MSQICYERKDRLGTTGSVGTPSQNASTGARIVASLLRVPGTMTCRYCGSTNADDEHRCNRCGRRLQATVNAASKSSAAPALESYQHAAEPIHADPVPSERPRLVYQAPLFGPTVMPA